MTAMLPVAMAVFFAIYLAFRSGMASEEEIIWTLVFFFGSLGVASYLTVI